ncbi:MAG: hypothetical protein FWC92_02465 [Defluviitaleaceae bacterium]|nr:hypothetical protein [Defluviitaleaceae bacterium]
MGEFLLESLGRYIGHTVTIFTTSGGLSGNGFTGVLAGICGCTVKLITDIGAPPSCPIGSACCGGFFEDEFEEGGCEGIGMGAGWCGMWGRCRGEGRRGRGRRRWGGRNWLGSVTEIPIDKIASFTHNAI